MNKYQKCAAWVLLTGVFLISTLFIATDISRTTPAIPTIVEKSDESHLPMASGLFDDYFWTGPIDIDGNFHNISSRWTVLEENLNIHIVWNANFTNASGDFMGMFYRRFDNVTRQWTSIQQIVEEPIGNLRLFLYKNIPTVAYCTSNNQGNGTVKFLKYTQGSWNFWMTAPKMVSTYKISGYFDAVIDQFNNIHLGWKEQLDFSVFHLNYQIFNATSESWSEIEIVAAPFDSPSTPVLRVGVNGLIYMRTDYLHPLGDIHFVFYIRTLEGIWTLLETPELTRPCNYFNIDYQGNIHVIILTEYFIYNQTIKLWDESLKNIIDFTYSSVQFFEFDSVGRLHIIRFSGQGYIYNNEYIDIPTSIINARSAYYSNGIIHVVTSGHLLMNYYVFKSAASFTTPDTEYELSTSESMKWTVSDGAIANANYTITKNGSVIQTGYWYSNTPITTSIASWNIEHYNITLYIDDGFGNLANQSKVIKIVNRVPTIHQNFTNIFIKGTVASLNWTLIDKSVANPTYSIAVDGVFLVNDVAFVSGDLVSFDISSLPNGTYQIKIVVNDGLSGITELVSGIMIQPAEVSDNDDGSDEDPNMSIYYIVGGVALVSFASIGVAKMKKSKINIIGEKRSEEILKPNKEE